jgi:hypothetical protein
MVNGGDPDAWAKSRILPEALLTACSELPAEPHTWTASARYTAAAASSALGRRPEGIRDYTVTLNCE